MNIQPWLLARIARAPSNIIYDGVEGMHGEYKLDGVVLPGSGAWHNYLEEIQRGDGSAGADEVKIPAGEAGLIAEDSGSEPSGLNPSAALYSYGSLQPTASKQERVRRSSDQAALQKYDSFRPSGGSGSSPTAGGGSGDVSGDGAEGKDGKEGLLEEGSEEALPEWANDDGPDDGAVNSPAAGGGSVNSPPAAAGGGAQPPRLVLQRSMSRLLFEVSEHVASGDLGEEEDFGGELTESQQLSEGGGSSPVLGKSEGSNDGHLIWQVKPLTFFLAC